MAREPADDRGPHPSGWLGHPTTDLRWPDQTETAVRSPPFGARSVLHSLMLRHSPHRLRALGLAAVRNERLIETRDHE